MKSISDNKKYTVEAVIFDLDGTLIDSKEVYFKILEEAFRQLGMEAPPREKVLEIIKKKERENPRALFPEKALNLPPGTFRKVMPGVMKLFPKLFRETVSLVPGADTMLRTLHTMGVKIGLVTSTHVRNLESKMTPLKRAEVADLFESVLCIEDVERCKPAPAPLIKCARQLGVPASRCMYVGDSCVDIRAGKAAGMVTIGVLTGMDGCQELEDEGPTEILDSVADLPERIFYKERPLKTFNAFRGKTL